MFILPNHKQIDYEAMIDAMLDRTGANIYWLDADAGKCDLETEIIKRIGKTNFLSGKNNRYFQVPKSSDANRRQWIEGFITHIVQHEDKFFPAKLIKTLDKENFYDNFIKELKKKDESWICGWNSWEGDNAFEEMKIWFRNLPLEIKEEMDIIDDDCPICRAVKEGRTSEKELKDVFREANFKSVIDDIYNKDDKKRP